MRGKLIRMTNELYFDTDCISAFLWINNTNILHELYGGKMVLPEPVYQELSIPCISHLKQRADLLIDVNDIFIKTIDLNTEEYNIYNALINGTNGRKIIGKGEASGIALAKTYNGILASNNYKDIMPYIDEYNLRHIDTGHILKEALDKGLITELDGNSIWSQMLAKRRMLPARSFTEYLGHI